MRIRFRGVLGALLLGVLLLTVVLVGGSANWNARFAVEDLGQQLMAQAGARIQQHVDAVLRVAVAQGEMNKELLEAATIDPSDHEGMTAFFLSALRAQETLSYLSFGLESGAYWHVYRDATGDISVQWLLPNSEGGFDLIDYAPQPDSSLKETFRDRNTSRTPPYDRPYYRAAKEAGRSTWPETYIFLSAGGKYDIPGVTRASPVCGPDGELLGVLSADFDLFALSRYLERVSVGVDGFAFLLELREDGSRRVIAHPDAPEQLALTTPSPDGEGSRALSAEDVADARVDGLLTWLPPVGIVIMDVLRPVRFEAEGTRYLGGFCRLAGEDRPAWVIAVVIPEEEVLGRIRSMNRITMLVALAGVVVVIVLSVWVSKRLSRPLVHIAKETEKIAAFELAKHPPKRSLVEEIDRLGTAMEEMKAGLRSFQKYVPAELVRSILASGTEAELGGDRRRITVYFSDVADFTSIAEALEPDVLVALLAEYLDVMTQQMLTANATVDKYIGDAIMAFWGAPHPVEDQAWLACHTALANQRAVQRLSERWGTAGRPAFRTRIGLHTGEAIVGNFGSEQRLDYTAMGDTVNLASRLEGLSKVYGTGILLSEDTYAEVKDRVAVRLVDRVAVKGRTGGTHVYELLGLSEDCDGRLLKQIREYEQCLDLYFGGFFDEAAKALTAFLEHVPDDGPAHVILARATEYAQTPPANDWTGVYMAKTK